jgi:DNA helicase-2/ATP-dependent DNA helicase PcrA
MTHFGSSYDTPGWQRAQRNTRRNGFEDDRGEYSDNGVSGFGIGGATSPDRTGTKAGLGRDRGRSRRVTIEGELIARSTGTLSDFAIGDRVFHQKFGNGNVIAIDGNKLVVQFDKAGEKRVVDSFVQRLMKH